MNVYKGSHDKNVYCLDITVKALKWKHNLDSTSIFASPVCVEEESLLFVCTLGGSLYLLDSITGSIKWSIKLGKPCFGTPEINKNKFLVFIGTCEGILFSFNFEGILVSQ